MSLSVQGITTLLNNSEGRDKLMKVHQYFARFMLHLLKSGNSEWKTYFDIIMSKRR
jgi:hypothetical protein